MATIIWSLICTAMVITTVVNFSKPAYEKLVAKRYESTISIALAFMLWLIASFSINYGIELEVGAKILLGLSLWTGASVWYDLFEVIKSFEKKDE